MSHHDLHHDVNVTFPYWDESLIDRVRSINTSEGYFQPADA
jgi:hypothetical protein